MNKLSSFISSCLEKLWNGYLAGAGKIFAPITFGAAVTTYAAISSKFYGAEPQNNEIRPNEQLSRNEDHYHLDNSSMISMTPEMFYGAISGICVVSLITGYILGKCTNNTHVTYNISNHHNYYDHIVHNKGDVTLQGDDTNGL